MRLDTMVIYRNDAQFFITSCICVVYSTCFPTPELLRRFNMSQYEVPELKYV